MKRTTALIIAVFFALGTEAQSKKEIPAARWSTGNIRIDGNSSDWKIPLDFYDSKAKISYSIANDSTHLYLCLQIVDERMQMKILRTGITVAIDTLGRRKQHISIHYPVIPNPGSPGAIPGDRPEMGGLRKNFKMRQQFLTLSGFRNGNGISPVQSINGVMVRLDWNAGNDMIYELAVPVGSFMECETIPEDPSQLFSLHISTPALEPSAFFPGGGPPDAVARSGGGAPPGGAGRPGGSGRPGGGGPPSWVTQEQGGAQNSFMTVEQRFRQKFRLAAIKQ